jgi:hypothetical protein
VLLRALNSYTITLELAQAQYYGFIVATHLDGQSMPLGSFITLPSFNPERRLQCVFYGCLERHQQGREFVGNVGWIPRT